MYDRLTNAIGTLADALWGSPITLVLLLGSGLYLTLRLAFVQVRYFPRALRQALARDADAEGDISSVQALATVLSATIGTGNIAGVATAVAWGGPGALFWMWITAIVGMATKFTECTLAVRFRQFDASGRAAGGPMYTLMNGLGMRRLGMTFALFAAVASFGIGNMVQANSVVDGLGYVSAAVDSNKLLTGVVMATLVGMVIIGGVQRIARVAGVLVPLMGLLYVGAAVVALILNIDQLPNAIGSVFRSAFSPAAAGGAIVGEAIRYGVARGLFSNEAGLGSSPMAFAATRTRDPAAAGLVAMIGPFIDTLVVCTLTGLVIITSGLLDTPDVAYEGAELTAAAFAAPLGNLGGYCVGLGITLFAFSTMIAWSYYGERCTYFLFGARAALGYKWLFVLLVVVGAVEQIDLVWNLAELSSLLMAAPNLIGVLLLAGLTRRLLDDHLAGRPPSAPTPTGS